MKKYFKIILSVFITLAIAGCDMDDDSLNVDLEGLAAPSDLGATFQITQDNTGVVTVIPTGSGATQYSIDFGDGSESADEIKPGETVTHVYEEGNYDVVVTGTNLAGKTAQGTQPLTVSFRQPENLEVTITKAANDSYTINVSAEAQYAAMFEVYFGDVDDEEPTSLMIGGTVSHTYDSVGDYEVRVVALSGGAASTELTQIVEIRDPIFLPIDFESATKDYTFYNFGPGGTITPIDNPDPTGVNTSAKVMAYTKPAGSEVWAGTNIPLDQPIDFSTKQYISVDVWSPTAGTPITLKVEKIDDNQVFVLNTVETTVSNQWETLIFDMSAYDPAIDYERVVLFFNDGTPGSDETYYFDNIQTTTLDPLKLPMTFDSSVTNYTPGVFGGTSFEVVANPDQSGANTSASMVGAITNAGGEWEGISFSLEEPVDFSTDNKTVTMKFWSDSPVSVLLKFEGGVNGERQTEVSADHTGNGWEELSFNFSTDAKKSYIDGNQGAGEPFVPTGQYGSMTIFVDGGKFTAGTFYMDDVQIGGTNTSYISLFSDVADDIEMSIWKTDWSVSDYEEITFDGQLVKHYYNLGYVGFEPVNAVDASNMTHFHLEVYTDNATAVKMKLVDFGPDGVYGGDDQSEHELTFDNLPLNEWVTLDIPLEDFTNLTNTSSIGQYILSGVPYQAANVYVRNIYFHN